VPGGALRPLTNKAKGLVRVLATMRTAAICSALWPAAACIAAASEEAGPGYEVGIVYTGEVWANAGGLDQGTRYLDNLDLQLTADLEQLIGWPGAKVFVYGLYNNGRDFSSDLAGDLQGISNIETGVEALRLYEAWIDQSFAGGQGSLRVGLYDLNSEFDAGNVRALFINPSHGIGPDFSQAGQNGPSIFPSASLAARISWTFDDGPYLRGAVFDGVPGDPAHPKRTTVDLSGDDGVLWVAEAGLTNDRGRIWSLGVWGYSARFDDLTEALTHRDNRGLYAAFEEPILSRGDGAPFDLAMSLRVGVANDDINPLSSFAGAVLVATGLIEARPDDRFGVGIAIANAGSKFRSTIGEPARREINLELTYRAQLTEWLALQPDLQWMIDPGADKAVDDVFAAGLRFEFAWTSGGS
jgi:porin